MKYRAAPCVPHEIKVSVKSFFLMSLQVLKFAGKVDALPIFRAKYPVKIVCQIAGKLCPVREAFCDLNFFAKFSGKTELLRGRVPLIFRLNFPLNLEEKLNCLIGHVA